MIKVRVKYYILLFVFIVTCVIFIVSTYAWFSSTLNVEITEFRIYVDFKDGLQISLDGVNWDEEVIINEENITSNLDNVYSMHTNRWSKYLIPVSTIGALNSRDEKFSIFSGNDKILPSIDYTNHDNIYTKLVEELKPTNDSQFLAFDIFINNLSHSLIDSNIYILDESRIENAVPEDRDVTILSSLRIGFLVYGSTPENSKPNTIQKLTCDPTCTSVIFEPYSALHGKKSIDDAKLHGIEIEDGLEYPTYGVYKEGVIEMFAGVHDSGIDFDTEHFEYQNTFKDIYKPIFTLPAGFTKIRMYIWIEAQDIDIIEMMPEKNKSLINIVFAKDIYGDY